MKKVGFIGLGIMGRPMALNLLQAGFLLNIVGRRAKKAVEELSARGASVYETPAEVARNSDATITCLPDTPDVLEVALGENGIIEGAREGSLFIDMSTISPAGAKRIASEMEKKGIDALDAPVSGGEKGAIEGTLSIMVGGDEEAFNRALPLFGAMGKNIVYVGGSGCGQIVKSANQIICTVTWQGIAEALALVAKAGVDPQKALQAISKGAARCWALEVRVPELLKGNFKPGFMARLQYKDLRIALGAASEFGVPLPCTSLVTEFYKAILERGRGEWDTSAVVTLTEELAGVKIRSKEV